MIYSPNNITIGNPCELCDSYEHTASNCDYEIIAEPIKCHRCGRKNHHVTSCYAVTNAYGRKLY